MNICIPLQYIKMNICIPLQYIKMNICIPFQYRKMNICIPLQYRKMNICIPLQYRKSKFCILLQYITLYSMNSLAVHHPVLLYSLAVHHPTPCNPVFRCKTWRCYVTHQLDAVPFLLIIFRTIYFLRNGFSSALNLWEHMLGQKGGGYVGWVGRKNGARE